jgi:hypothetical protein
MPPMSHPLDRTKSTRKPKREQKPTKEDRSKTTTSSENSSTLRKTKGDARKIQISAPIITTGTAAAMSHSTAVLLHPSQDVDANTGGLLKRATGLASGDMSMWFSEQVAKTEASWDELSPAERMAELVTHANTALNKFGIPPVGVMPGLGDNPSFFRQNWGISYPVGFADFDLDHQRFTRLAGTVYHEVRHAEQAFRVARKLAAEGRNANEIGRILGITPALAQLAVDAPKLSRNQTDEWTQAQAWQDNLLGTPEQISAGDVNDRMAAALKTYHDTEGRLTKFDNPSTDPDVQRLHDQTMQEADGAAKWAKMREELKAKYVQDRDLFRQWFTFSTMMPVEEDAWAVGGQIETLLAGKPYTPQDVMAEQMAPDARTMVKAPPKMDYELLLALMSFVESEGNPAPQ